MAGDVPGKPGVPIALGSEGIELARTHFDDSELAGNEKAVYQDEENDCQEFRKMTPGTSELVAGGPTASATLARRGRVFNSVSGLKGSLCFRRPEVAHDWRRDAFGALSRIPARWSGRLPKGQLRASTSEFFETGSSRRKYPGAGLRRCAQ